MKSLFTLSSSTKINLVLSFLTAILLGISFPPFQTGIFACVGFVPFFFLVERIEPFWRFFRYSYATFFVFCCITLYWVGGFTHLKDPYLMLAGGAVLLFQPLYFTIASSVYYFVRKKTVSTWTVLVFPLIWITFEWLYALGEFAFPWLTIGNTQTYQLEKIQFTEITGVYGVSLWVLTLNILFYFLIKSILIGGITNKKNVYLLLGFSVVYFLPNIYSATVDESRFRSSQSLTVGIIQPNVDPWDKWEGANTFSGRMKQVETYLQLIGKYVNNSTDIVVLPESAILLNLPEYHEEYSNFKKIIDSLNVAVISGYIKVKYYDHTTAPVSSSVIKGTNIRYDSFNSVMFVEPHKDGVQSYSKMRLVPFAERIPYADQVPFLIEPLRWGVGISNWGLLHDSTVFVNDKLHTKFLGMVCYESIFPEFVSSFVNKGAEFLVFITNDSWWGNTSGARQHNQFAVMRAIENRRWVVRCANGGISSFIDPTGRMYDATTMYTQTYIQHKIEPLQTKTFYTLHGDWVARILATITVIILLETIIYSLSRKVK
ncbi:MAG: apolipoprotein N-acyltransferase [Bacteroidota bacterium]|nr:apolipoprotein N-acyltransferase [Bacteroidota bacterium]